MADSFEFEVSTLRFADSPTIRINPFTQEKLTVYRRQPFSADEMQAINRLFAATNAAPSNEEGWIDISLGSWTSHVEFDSGSQLAAFRMECSGLPPREAMQVIFSILSQANAYMNIGLKQAGPHELSDIGAKAMLQDYRRVSTPDELADWIKSVSE